MNKKTIFMVAGLFIIIGIFIIASCFSKVVVIADDLEYKKWTIGGTVEDVIKKLNIQLNKNDEVIPALNTKIKNSCEIQINRAKKISFSLKGQEKTLYTTCENVAKLLEQLKIQINPKDIIEPNLETIITEAMNIKVIEVTEKEVIIEEKIPYEKEEKIDNSLYKGETKFVSKGIVGIDKKKFLVTYHDGIEINKELISSEVIKKPKKELLLKGTKQIIAREGQNLNINNTLVLTATAYTHTGNKTYTDLWPQRGTVAVDPKVIPLGTKLYIDGYGFAVAEDIGGAIKGKRIDLFMDTKKEALNWGRKAVKVFVLK